MTKTPMVQRLWTQAQLTRPSKATLTEPFLSPADGKLHTTGKLERSTMGRRWLVLALTSFFMGCNYYCYDNPAALYRPLQNAYRNEPQFEVYYDLLYSVYSIPNIVLPLFGGLLVDKAGLYISLNLFSSLILVGQAVFATGCSLGSLPLMLVGRFLFGLGARTPRLASPRLAWPRLISPHFASSRLISPHLASSRLASSHLTSRLALSCTGGESISVAQSALIERWFVAGELGFALGGVLSISRLGSVINNALSPYIASATYSVAAPLWLGTLLCTLGLLSCVAVQWLDADAARVLRANPAILVEPSPPPPPRFVLAATSTNASPVAAAVPSASFSYRAPPLPPLRTKLPPLPSIPSRSAATDAQRTPAVTPSDGGDGGSGGAASGTPPPSPPPSPPAAAAATTTCAGACEALMLTMARDVRMLPRPFWLLAIMCCIVYGAVLPFNNVASALLLDRDYFPQGTIWQYPGGQKTFVYDGSNDHRMAIMCSNREGHARDSAFCKALAEAQTTAGLVMSEPYVPTTARPHTSIGACMCSPRRPLPHRYVLSALLTPLFGSMVDQYGQRATLVVLSAALLATSHALLALTSLPAPLLLVGIGLGYAVFASVIWPSIPSVVGRQQLGIAYGLVTTLQNSVLFVLPLVVGMVLELLMTSDEP